MEYKGWKLFDKVILIAKPKDKNGFEQAFVVEDGNASQKETAIRWAGGYYGSKREYHEYAFDNKDFEIELFDSADSSSQGGKLSFWDCLIYKDGHVFQIGINSEYLLSLLKSSTTIKGKIQEKVFFATSRGRVGMIHQGMQEYKEALHDMEHKENMKRSKTTKYKRGYVYSSITQSEVYIGEIYSWIDEDSRGYAKGLLDKPIKHFILVDIEDVKNCKSISDYFKIQSKVTQWWYRSLCGQQVLKLLPRVEENQLLTDDYTSELLQQTLDKMLDNYINNQTDNDGDYLQYLCCSAYPDKKPKITQELIDKVNNSKNAWRTKITYNPSWFERKEI